MQHRRGVSQLVSLALYVAIAIAAIGIALTIGMPQIETMQETASLQNSIDFLTKIDTAIREVAAEGQYSSRTVNLHFRRGSYAYDPELRELYYELDTDSGIISTHASQHIGPVRLSANADVSVTNATRNGIECYLLENQYLEACIRKIHNNFDPDRYPALIGYWRMNEGTGQWANDSSNAGNDGTRGGSTSSEAADPTWVNGVHENGLDFDGAGDYFHVPYDTTLDVTANITVSAWVKMDGKTGSNQFVVSKYTGATTDKNQYSLFYHDASNTTAFEIHDSTYQTANGTIDINDGNWHHVAGTYNGETLTLYIDGAIDRTLSHSGSADSDGTGDIFVGRQAGVNNRHFNGTIDEVQVYNRTLTSEEVEWLYLQRGDEHYVNTSEMVVSLHNKVDGTTLNGTLYTHINNSAGTRDGTGHTTVERVGGKLGQGRVAVNVTTASEGQYDVDYRLLSGSDFLTVQADADNVTTGLDFVVDDRGSDTVYIDGQIASPGIHTSNDISFGYGIGVGSDLMSGVVAGTGFTQVEYDDQTAGGRYEIAVTNTGDNTFLIPYTLGGVGDVENREDVIRDGVFGTDRFFSYPDPNFAYELSEEKTTRAALTYDTILLHGPRQEIAQGTYQLLVQNNGVVDGKANVSVSVR